MFVFEYFDLVIKHSLQITRCTHKTFIRFWIFVIGVGSKLLTGGFLIIFLIRAFDWLKIIFVFFFPIRAFDWPKMMFLLLEVIFSTILILIILIFVSNRELSLFLASVVNITFQQIYFTTFFRCTKVSNIILRRLIGSIVQSTYFFSSRSCYCNILALVNVLYKPFNFIYPH